MRLAKEFFDLQLDFADRVGRLVGIPFAQALLDYTNLYVRFRIDRHFDPRNSIWHEYLDGLSTQGDGHDWTYRFYLRSLDARAAAPVAGIAGCFS